MIKKKEYLILGVLLLFTILTAVRHFSSPGSDLTSSYYSCRLLAAHQSSELYHRDPVDYDRVRDPVWTRLALATGVSNEKELHPFVQTPLWAYSLEPLCTRVNFPAFNLIFLWLTSFCLSGTIWLIARFWAPRLFHPGWIALICAALYLSEAYKYSMVLTQTHVIFVLLTVAALILARKDHYVWAGALLAAAAAVKITPGFLLLYWLVIRQWRASASFVLFSGLLFAASVLATGWALNMTYLQNLSQISNMLLVSWNNQSLAAFLMAPRYPYSETLVWHTLHLPKAVKLLSLLLSIASTLVGGLMDRKAARETTSEPPYGAAFALTGATVFAAIAWTHYYIILLLPLIMMLNVVLKKRSFLILSIVVVVFALNFDTQTMGGVLLRYRAFPIVRAQFYSGLIGMVGLALISLQQRKRLDQHPVEVREVTAATHEGASVG